MPVAPPFPRMPSLNALRAFEAAARLGGFAAAAAELQVTPGAVAAQVKALEDDLGAPLFVRDARGVRLTAAGQRALPGFVAAFDGLGQAMRDLRAAAGPARVHVAALPALAQLWLAPRLPGLRAALPGVEVSMTALEAPPNLKRVPFDLCLFPCDALPPGGAFLLADDLLPVCAPALAPRLTRPQDLWHLPCLTDSAWAGDWHRWIAAALPGADFVPQGPVFSLYAVAVAEAVAGAGVLMAHRRLVAGHLASGALVAPLDLSVPLRQGIALWMLPGGRSGRDVARVAEVLRALA